MLNVHGQGRCAITLDPQPRQPGQQPYQGVVPLHGDRREPLQKLSQVLEHYMLQSEQLDTRLVLAADDRVAAGLLIQRLPVDGPSRMSGERNEDQIGLNEDFNRIAHLAATLDADELRTLDIETVLRRLFWQERLLRFEPQQARFACNCARERVRNMLVGLGQPEVRQHRRRTRQRRGRLRVLRAPSISSTRSTSARCSRPIATSRARRRRCSSGAARRSATADAGASALARSACRASSAVRQQMSFAIGVAAAFADVAPASWCRHGPGCSARNAGAIAARAADRRSAPCPLITA